MSHIQSYEQGDMDYAVEFRRTSEEAKESKRSRPQYGRKRGKSPSTT